MQLRLRKPSVFPQYEVELCSDQFEKQVKIKTRLSFVHKTLEFYNLRWKTQIFGASKTSAQTDYHNKTLLFALFYIENATDVQFKNTVLHEIAHILAGPFENHNATWKRIAKQIGNNGKLKHNFFID